ncbi:MAG: response regulator [Anaeromyxobacteraceae bacterium]
MSAVHEAPHAHVLIVDDDVDLVARHRAVLEAAGHRASVAHSAAEGRTAVEALRPDLLILDVMMERFDAGFELARWMAKAHPATPILMLTGVDDHLDEADLEAQDRDGWLPVHRYVEKPLAPAVLVEAVEHLLEETSRAPAGAPHRRGR